MRNPDIRGRRCACPGVWGGFTRPPPFVRDLPLPAERVSMQTGSAHTRRPAMAKIAILVEKMYEDAELQYPRLRLKEAGHDVHIVGPKANETYVGKYGYPQRSERAASAVRAEDYQLIVIPGGS